MVSSSLSMCMKSDKHGSPYFFLMGHSKDTVCDHTNVFFLFTLPLAFSVLWFLCWFVRNGDCTMKHFGVWSNQQAWLRTSGVWKLVNITLLLTARWISSQVRPTGPNIDRSVHPGSTRGTVWYISADYRPPPSEKSAQQKSSTEGDIYLSRKTPVRPLLPWLLLQHEAHFSASSHYS